MTFPRETDLLVNQTVDIAPPSPGIPADGALKTVAVWGTFDGATVILQESPDNGNTWITLKKSDGSPAEFIIDGIEVINVLKTGLLLGAIVATAGGSTNVNAKIF